MALLELAPPRVRVSQFNLTVEKGGRYLQTATRTMAIGQLALIFLAYTSSATSPAWDLRCTLYALMFGIAVSMAPYEICFIFPINDRVVELGKALEVTGEKEENEKIDKELTTLARKWRFRNWGRAGPSLVISVLMAFVGSPLITAT